MFELRVDGEVTLALLEERLGFVREAVLRQREWLCDHFVDHVVYGMLSSEWARRRGER